LQNEVCTATILNNVDISLETRARARLVGHKFIIDAIKIFRNKYPDWKSSLTDLLNDLGSKSRAKKKPKPKNTVKAKTEKKSKITKKDENTISDKEKLQTDLVMTEENLSKFENTLESECYNTNLINLHVTPEQMHSTNLLPIENNTSRKDEHMIAKAKEIKSTKCDTSIKSSEVEVDVLETSPYTSLSSSKNKFVDKSINVEFNKKQLKIKSEQIISNELNKTNKRHIIDEITPVCETVDSFFMTTDDKDYMSVFKPPPLVEKIPVEHSMLDYPKPPKEIFIKGKKLNIKQNYTGNRRERRQKQIEEPADIALHPSWEAKRKLKSLAKFEGKKITFDDDD